MHECERVTNSQQRPPQRITITNASFAIAKETDQAVNIIAEDAVKYLRVSRDDWVDPQGRRYAEETFLHSSLAEISRHFGFQAWILGHENSRGGKLNDFRLLVLVIWHLVASCALKPFLFCRHRHGDTRHFIVAC